MLFRASAAAVLASAATAALTAQSEPQRPTFRSSLDLVSVAVVVRAPDGRIVSDLRSSDFEVLDRGVVQPIVQFQPGGDADARVAVLLDSSGSMVVGPKRERTRIATDMLVAGLKESDSASVFSFDAQLQRLTPFTRDAEQLRTALTRVEPYGVTCLYDAIVGTIRTVADEAPRTRALLLMTDGLDTNSVNSPVDAATAAAALDIPLYVLSVGKGQVDDRPLRSEATAAAALALDDLATRTGGLAAEVATPAEISIATRTILSELRHQYVLAFQAGTARGWHDLTVRVKRGRVQARSRNGYVVS